MNSSADGFGRPTADGAFLLLADASVRWYANETEATIFAQIDASPRAPAKATRLPPRPDFLKGNQTKKIHIVWPNKGETPEDSESKANTILANHPSVSGLVAPTWSVCADDLDLIRTCSKLSYLRIAGTDDEDTLEQLKNINNLKVLVINNVVIFERQ